LSNFFSINSVANIYSNDGSNIEIKQKAGEHSPNLSKVLNQVEELRGEKYGVVICDQGIGEEARLTIPAS
jgi:hypothetical protein